MLQPVALAHKNLTDDTHIVGRPQIEEIRELAEPLKGKHVVHLSATAFGGGVSQILCTLVPLMRDIGLEAEWQVIYGQDEFFGSTKLMHNALQGHPDDLSEEQWATWRQYNEMNARELSRGWDVVKQERPDVQHALVGSMASDDPEGWDFYNSTLEHAARRPGHPHPQHLQQRRGHRGQRLPVARRRRGAEIDARGLRAHRVGAALEGASVTGGDVGGIPLQVSNGVTGYVVGTVEDCAARALDIVNDPALGKALGRRGKEHVRANFLTPRYLRDYLRIFHEVLS